MTTTKGGRAGRGPPPQGTPGPGAAGAPDWEVLARELPARRWFGGKGRPIAGVRAVDRAVLSPSLALWAVEVAWADGGPAHVYVLPLAPGAAGLDDALADDGAARALLDALRGRRALQAGSDAPEGAVRSERGLLRSERFDALAEPISLDALGPAPEVQRLSAEQSNTSIAFGGRAILKLIRRLEGGPNPELEIGAHLARLGFDGAPRLLGALAWEGPASGTVAVAHEFVAGAEQGWDWALDALRPPGPPPPWALRELEALGAAVGALHLALADARGDPAFAPEPLTAGALEAWTAALSRELDDTLRVASAAVPALAAREPALRARIARLRAAEPAGLLLRQHGDLHLGQVLRRRGRWLIFDFEGEPLRPLAERRRKWLPVKDLAGMLRSISYAAAAAERAGGTRAAPPDAARADRAGPARQVLLGGYLSRASGLLPKDPAAFRALLDAAELEKLLYELRYEVGHRPDWVEIPARDLLAQEPR